MITLSSAGVGTSFYLESSYRVRLPSCQYRLFNGDRYKNEIIYGAACSALYLFIDGPQTLPRG